MNVNYNSGVIVNVKIEEVSCFYFWDHFYKAFKKKEPIKSASVLRSHSSEEVIAYCCSCQDKIRKLCCQFESLSDSFFTEAKKNFIQYYPVVKWKGVCVIDINCYGW